MGYQRNLACIVLLSLPWLDVRGAQQNVYRLPDNYQKKDPPNLANPETADQPQVLSVKITILDILGVEEDHNEVSMDIVIRRSWFEPRLEFSNPPPEGTTFTVDDEDVDSFWVPSDLYVMGMRDIGFGTKGQNLRYLMLSHDKTVQLLLRADLIMRCKFDFQFYPLDIQVCKLDFTSLTQTTKTQLYAWRNDSSVSFRGERMTSDVPKYRASLKPCMLAIIAKGLSGDSSALRVWLTLERELKPFLLECFAPTGLFVVVSWGSFLVKPEIVPGRMVLLITTLLSLVTLFEASRNQGPPASDINCLDVWLMCCIMFVFMAMLEYATILMRIRGYFCVRSQNKVQAGLPEHCQINTARQTQQQRSVDSSDCYCHFKDRVRRFLMAFYQDTSGHLLDKTALVLFPITFLLYNLIYWNSYLYNDAIHKECPQIDSHI